MIDLYTWPTPNGHKIHIMLEETGTPYRVIPIDIGKGDQFKPDYVAINPNSGEILGMVGDTPDITLSELAEHLDEAHGVKAAQSTIWRLLDRHGMTFKKNRARQRAAAG